MTPCLRDFMLSTKEIKNVGQASHYFMAQDNYYSQEEGMAASEWWGKGARKLSLLGEIDQLRFQELLAGKIDDIHRVGKMMDGEFKHRPGWDLTFSAPKSVSMLALIGEDKRLVAAHQAAVKVALSKIEESCSQARIQVEGETVYQNTENMIASLFHHDLSRSADPQLHTHCVVFNLTERKDGEWRSQASQIGRYGEETNAPVNGFIERVRHDKRYYGQLYRNELAYQVSQLGYTLDVDHKTGFFEISGVSSAAIEHFSQRRADITAYLKENNLSGAKAASVATLKTRENKKELDREELKSEWQNRAAALQFDSGQLIQDSLKPRFREDQREGAELACDVIKKAANDIAIFQSTFSREELIKRAGEYVMGEPVSVSALLAALQLHCESGELIPISEHNGKTGLMAKTTLQNEEKLFALANKKNLDKPIVKTEQLNQYLAQHTEQDHKNLKNIFNDEAVILLEGNSSTLITSVIKSAKKLDVDMMLLSPSLIGSKVFSENFRNKPKTFWQRIQALLVEDTMRPESVLQFLSREESTRNPAIVIVNQAHLLSTYQALKLLEWGQKNNTKLVLLGDSQTLLPQQTGTPFLQLKSQGIRAINAHQEKYDINLDMLKDRLIEIKEDDDRTFCLARHYTQLHPTVRKEAWVVVQSKERIKMLNDQIHEELKQAEVVTKTMMVNILNPHYLSENKKCLASSYTVGDLIRFNESDESLGVSRGEYCKVVRVLKQQDHLQLEKSNGLHVFYKPAPMSTEYFTEEKREIGIGENILFQRSIKELGIVKGERFFIKNISKERLKLESVDGKIKTLNLQKESHRHFDYGYATKVHAIAHENPEYLIAEFKAFSSHSNQRYLNQVVTQAKKVWIYTDHLEALVHSLSHHTGDRLSAHEILKKSEETKKSLNVMVDILQNHLAKTTNGTLEPEKMMAIHAIEYTLQHLSEREAGFTHKEIMETAMRYSLGHVNEEQLVQVINECEKSGVLLKGTQSHESLWTTLAAVKMEREILGLSQIDKNKLTSITTDDVIKTHCKDSSLKLEQIEAIKLITQSKDRVIAVQGYAGTGKTTMLKIAQDVLVESQYKVLGLAPTHTAAKELIARGIEAQTIDSFIATKNPTDQSQCMLFVDEASMISNRKMVQLLKIVHQSNYRIALIGDYRQLPAIESGKPQRLVQSQVVTAHLTDIQRQHNPNLKKAVKETIAYDFRSAFDTLKDNIMVVDKQVVARETGKNAASIKNDEERLFRIQKFVDKFVSYPADQREQILLYTPGHEDRVLVNVLIREHYKQEGLLTQNDHEFPVLVSKNLTQVERTKAINFNIGDVLRFSKSLLPGVKSGDYFKISEIHREHDLLVLDKSGVTLHWQLPRFNEEIKSSIEVFETDVRDIQVGDVIRWSRSNKAEGLFSAEPAKVTAISDEKITITYASNKQLSFDPRNPNFQHWDHGYASTGYGAQGQTRQQVLALFESYRINLVNQTTFLVALTRAVDDFTIYTDSSDKLLQAILSRKGIKRSSLEVIGEYPEDLKKAEAKDSDKKAKDESHLILHSRYVDPSAVEKIRRGLNADAERIAITLLGEPKMRMGNTLRFGNNKGSLIVTTGGLKQGMWYDFAPERTLKGKSGGDMLTLIQLQKSFTFKEAVDFGAQWLSLDTKPVLQQVVQSIKLKNATDLEEKNKIHFAEQLVKQSQPVRGTLAEKYLKVHRGIIMEKYPDDFRFHPGIYSKLNEKTLPALLVIARDPHRNVRAVQAIYLDQGTANKIDKSQVRVQKQSFGKISGSAVTIPGNDKGTVLIAEGPETGLSLAKAFPDATVQITLGKSNFFHIDIPIKSNVIFCLDNDGKDLKLDPLIFAAANRLVEQKHVVSLVAPGGTAKKDYNDVIKAHGIGLIQNDIKQAERFDKFYSPRLARLIEPAISNAQHKIDLLKVPDSIKINKKGLEINL